MKRLVPAQAGEAMTGNEVWQWVNIRRVGQPVLDAKKREDGRLTVGWYARAEAALLLIDCLAEPFLGVHRLGPFHGNGETEVDRGAMRRTPDDSMTPTILPPVSA